MNVCNVFEQVELMADCIPHNHKKKFCFEGEYNLGIFKELNRYYHHHHNHRHHRYHHRLGKYCARKRRLNLARFFSFQKDWIDDKLFI